ncbi:hypothetical protein HPB48_001242 [Haemaphysalis longicornis]|uniref:Uncharacterized protein n=1 Tax=Haemaphysalis longicornis TaxID=44386 RepID=A0A9J6FI17_HAELO|nr:hypothetical protein HPB48_001242 [Haemaphysalis longicornis]
MVTALRTCKPFIQTCIKLWNRISRMRRVNSLPLRIKMTISSRSCRDLNADASAAPSRRQRALHSPEAILSSSYARKVVYASETWNTPKSHWPCRTRLTLPARALVQVKQMTLGTAVHPVSLYGLAPDDARKGVIHGVPLRFTNNEILSNLDQTEHEIYAVRLGQTTTVILTFAGPKEIGLRPALSPTSKCVTTAASETRPQTIPASLPAAFVGDPISRARLAARSASRTLHPPATTVPAKLGTRPLHVAGEGSGLLLQVRDAGADPKARGLASTSGAGCTQ